MGSCSLAIETSSQAGAIALGRGNDLLATALVPQHRRHNLELMPTIARLCADHAVMPADIAEVYVSIGPGSFTGLRIGIATAKMLAMTQGVRVVAVPTLDVLVQNASPQDSPVAVCLNLKHDTTWSSLYAWDGDRWSQTAEPALRTAAEVEALSPRTTLDHTAVPRSEALWRLGREAAGRGAFTEAMRLSPLYAREPEAVVLWEKRQAKTA
jgi:tRNA threonylcarbamoyladenosine biosynthesis protein TsaB